MKPRIVALLIFVILGLFQLITPLRSMIHRNFVLESGKTFRFSTSSVIPSEDHRGSFMNIDYAAGRIERWKGEMPAPGTEVFVTLRENSQGLAEIDALYQEEPAEAVDYVKAVVRYAGDQTLSLGFPFNRYYSEAGKIETMSRDRSADYIALVKVHGGVGVIEDLVPMHAIQTLAGISQP